MNNKSFHSFHEKVTPLEQLNDHEYKKDVRFNEIDLEKILHTLQRIETKMDILLMQRDHRYSCRIQK
jgi:hypothetical protein